MKTRQLPIVFGIGAMLSALSLCLAAHWNDAAMAAPLWKTANPLLNELLALQLESRRGLLAAIRFLHPFDRMNLRDPPVAQAADDLVSFYREALAGEQSDQIRFEPLAMTVEHKKIFQPRMPQLHALLKMRYPDDHRVHRLLDDTDTPELALCIEFMRRNPHEPYRIKSLWLEGPVGAASHGRHRPDARPSAAGVA